MTDSPDARSTFSDQPQAAQRASKKGILPSEKMVLSGILSHDILK
jgi:hypothetical protein